MCCKPSDQQLEAFLVIVLANPVVLAILNDPPFDYETPWYIASGILYQSVWNSLNGRPLLESIEDCDIVYFDTDCSKEKELATQARIQEKYRALPMRIEPINQARVHLWHQEDFGYAIEPYESCEDAIARWPSTTVSVALTKRGEKIEVFAPYGLDDIFGMIGRPNLSSGLKRMYEGKAKKWLTKWPQVVIVPWGEE